MDNCCLAFDLGRVVFDFDYVQALEKMSGSLKAAHDQVLTALFYDNFGVDFEKGLISGEEFYSRFRQTFSTSLSYAEFVPIWCDIFTPKREVISLVEKLRKNYPVYIISNINELHFEFLAGRYGRVFDLFRGLVLSYRVKSVKPEKKIFDALVRMSGHEPCRTVYIDDREDLISAARELDFISLHYTGYERLLKDLSGLDINP